MVMIFESKNLILFPAVRMYISILSMCNTPVGMRWGNVQLDKTYCLYLIECTLQQGCRVRSTTAASIRTSITIKPGKLSQIVFRVYKFIVSGCKHLNWPPFCVVTELPLYSVECAQYEPSEILLYRVHIYVQLGKLILTIGNASCGFGCLWKHYDTFRKKNFSIF